MPSIAFKGTPAYKKIGILTPQVAKYWIPSLMVWGVGAGIYTTYILSVTPLVKREFLTKIPILRSYYEDKVPPEDKPF